MNEEKCISNKIIKESETDVVKKVLDVTKKQLHSLTDRTAKGLILKKLIHELYWLRRSGLKGYSDIEVITINGEYNLTEEEKEKYADDLKLHVLYKEFCLYNLKEVRVPLGNFQHTFNYEKSLKHAIEDCKEMHKDRYSRFPSYIGERMLLSDAKQLCAAEIRDEFKNLQEREEKIWDIYHKYVSQLNVNLHCVVIEGCVVFYDLDKVNFDN